MECQGQQVLDLVLAHLTDARTLLNCFLVDQHISQHVQHTVQQRLQQLVEACSISSCTVQSDRACLAWLCTMAGTAAVNSHAVGCALLNKVMQLPDEVRPLMKATGLKLTNRLVVHMALQRMQQLSTLLRRLAKKKIPGCEDCTYLQLYLGIESYTVGQGVAGDLQAKLNSLLFGASAETLLDLLALAVSQAQIDPSTAVRLGTALLDHDKQQLHVLHPKDSTEAHGLDSRGKPVCSSSCSRPSNNNGTAPRPTAGAPEVQDRPDDSTQVRFAQLLENCVMYRLPAMLVRLAALPAGQCLGVHAVTKLLYLAVLQQQCHSGQIREMALIVSALTSLPAAKDLPVDCIHTLLLHSVDMGTERWPTATHLLKLPGAKQLSSMQICQLIQTAGRCHNPKSMLQELGRWADDRQLERQDVMQLLRGCIQRPWPSANQHGSIWDDNTLSTSLQWLSTLEPGRHIIGDDVLELLELCEHVNFRGNWTSIPLLTPASQQVQDVQRFVACIKRAAAGFRGQYGQERVTAMITSLLQAMPVAQQLQPSDWLAVFAVTIQQLGDIPVTCSNYPVLQQLNAKDLWHMLQVAVDAGCGVALVELCSVPAVQQLRPPFLCHLLLQLLPHRRKAYDGPLFPHNRPEQHSRDVTQLDKALYVLLELSVAAQMPGELALQVLDQAVELGMLEVAQLLQKQLGYTSEWHTKVNHQQLQLLIRNAIDWRQLEAVSQALALPCCQQLTAAGVLQLLLHALARLGKLGEGANTAAAARQLDQARQRVGKSIAELQELPGLQQLGADGVCQLLSAGFDSGADDKCISVLAALPGAAAITATQLAQLVQSQFTKIEDLRGWQVLLSLPAAQQLTSRDIGELLQRCLRSRQRSRDGWPSEDFVCKLKFILGFLSVDCVDAAEVQGLLATCIELSKVDTARVLLEKLPAVQRLSADQVRALLQLSALKTAERSMSGVLAALLELPGVQAFVRGDACLQAMVDALRALEASAPKRQVYERRNPWE